MLTSERKICKLFIKFVAWNKCSKAEQILARYPEYIMPWQKAFEEAFANKSYNSCKWIYNKANMHAVHIDIHYKNNEIMVLACKMDYLDIINMIIQWDSTYPWLEHIMPIIETSKYKDKIIDIIKHNSDIFICYSEDRGGGKTSTSIAKATFAKENLNFKNIFQANPPINSGYHFGCRLVIKDNMIYASAGERGNGNIAQDPKTHVGKMIRINLDGSAPKDKRLRGPSRCV